MAKNTYSMQVLGTTFTLQSNDDTEHLRAVAELFRAKVQEIQSRTPASPPLDTAVLSALNLADELIRERASRPSADAPAARESDEIEQRTERMIAAIDSTLGDAEAQLP